MSEIKIKCAYDEIVEIKDLKPHPKNPNKHSKEQIERLAKVIEYQGIRRPIRVSKRSGFITSGHGLSLSLGKLKMESAPVSFQDYDNDEQEFADLVADNSLQSWSELDLSLINLEIPDLGPDFDVDLLGIKDFVIEPADKYGDQDADATPEVRETPIRLGDLFQLGSHRLLCGDSTKAEEVSRLMNGEKADMVFTDPPYGIDYQDVKHKHRKIEGDDSLDRILELLSETLKMGVPMFICCNWKCYSTFESAMKEYNKAPKACIVWDKGSRIQNLDKFGKQHEFILYHGPFGGESTIDVDVWQCSREVSKDHPTSKPIELIERALKSFRGSVFDPFLGSGSTLIACEKTNRKCFGMEIDPQYCQVIIDRWEKFTGQKAEKLDC